jgi:hypothetical protein
MLPLASNALRLEEIAEYWPREIAGVRTMAEIYARLLSSFGATNSRCWVRVERLLSIADDFWNY